MNKIFVVLIVVLFMLFFVCVMIDVDIEKSELWLICE